ncbi:MAG: aminotransferase class I/II-fold pyridoxal phosphate-dependent enzyme [Negativicutes bacterium]|nr:aminotransferase class I/II-fold pyridoxal phosphate-dependent enzyme [Negativicutes bacterium]
MDNIRNYASQKARRFTESVIREMSRVADAHKAINLAQGFPDFPAPDAIKQAAVDAIMQDHNQYAITWGAKSLRDSIVWKFERDYGVTFDPELNLTVCCGATEAMIATLLATINPGEEVIVFEPFYENYGADTILCGATPKYVKLHAPDFSLDRTELAAAFNDRTRAIIINTPHNPTGKVFSLEELTFIAELCIKYDVLAITDEIYEHILYDDAKHIPIWKLPGMEARSIIINGISKTYSVTGWRIGYVIASPELSHSIRKVHDFLTVGAAAPLQEAAAKALRFNPEYYDELSAFYGERRDFLYDALVSVGFKCFKPSGAYYIMADITPFGWKDDVEFALHLTKEIGVAVVPGSSFYCDGSPDGKKLIRFCFCKEFSTLQAAVERLNKLKA